MLKAPMKEKEVKEIEEKQKSGNGTWGDDQQNRGYYYDDAHGYETYTPEDETDEHPEKT